jgi:hypothetical protein
MPCGALAAVGIGCSTVLGAGAATTDRGKTFRPMARARNEVTAIDLTQKRILFLRPLTAVHKSPKRGW